MSQANFEAHATKSKLFVAHCTLRNGEFETTVKRLFTAHDLAAAEAYAMEEGMASFDGSDEDDKTSYQEEGQPRTWYFAGGEWCVTLNNITEIADPEHAKIIAGSGLVQFL